MSPLNGFAFAKQALDYLATVPLKQRVQIIKKARALQAEPFPVGHKRLKGIHALEGDPVFRERSGDYRILYVVRENPGEVIVIDIDHRKDVYR